MSETELRNADIDTALTEAKEAYVARNPKSFARFVEATAVMPGGNTRTVLHYAPFPLGIARGEGCRLWDLDGAEYIDFLGEYTAGIYGHSHPMIRAAVDRALDAGINFGGTNLTEAKFARAVCDRFGLERVRFTNSGTEANLLAISVGRIFTRRSKVMVFDGGYHGAVFGFAGGGSPINAPFDYVLAPYNDIAATRALIEQHASDLALVILEPMMGGGGCIAAAPEFLTMLREATTQGRRAADPGRGDDVASVAGRSAAGARDQAGPDDVREVYRRRHVVRCVRRTRRHHGPVRSAPPGCAAACRHVQQQRADHVGRAGRADRGLHARRGASAERARRCAARTAERAVPVARRADAVHRHRLDVRGAFHARPGALAGGRGEGRRRS